MGHLLAMPGVRLFIGVIGLTLVLAICGCSSKAAAKADDLGTPLVTPGKGLFGSHEFRSTLSALPHWTRVMTMAEQQVEEMSSCDSANEPCSSAALSWQKIIAQTQSLSPQEQMRQVNSFFNRWPYRLDIDVYGVSDYWAAPGEFMRLSGDCEDYCITKYYALRQLGFPVEKMRIVVLRDTIRSLVHAVLAVESDGETLILDNLSDLVLPHTRYEHYVPQYSVNEQFRWAHVAPGLVRINGSSFNQ